MIGRLITAYGRPGFMMCDARCDKAWGINNRPRVQLDDKNEDDYCYLADGELGEAPEDPGTYEGSHPKPQSPEERLNKWCFRECERSEHTLEMNERVDLKDFSVRRYNCPPHTREENVIEVGVVVGLDGQPLMWHQPDGRDGGSIPDSRELWQVLWNNRDMIAGFAHSHPGFGVPGPSYKDVTTFAAIEAGLGKRLQWWITSADKLSVVRWKGPERLSYEAKLVLDEPDWVLRLRQLSKEDS
jgi:hypothetical protein